MLVKKDKKENLLQIKKGSIFRIDKSIFTATGKFRVMTFGCSTVIVIPVIDDRGLHTYSKVAVQTSERVYGKGKNQSYFKQIELLNEGY